MRNRLAVVFLLFAAFATGLAPSVAPAQQAAPTVSSVLVKLVSGLTAIEQAAVIARNGGVEVRSVPALRLHVIEVATAELSALASVSPVLTFWPTETATDSTSQLPEAPAAADESVTMRGSLPKLRP